MKKLLIISSLLLLGLNGFGQKDTTSLFWENGTKKYEHICCFIDTIYLSSSSNDKPTPNITHYMVETFWNKSGKKIEELDFIKQYESKEIIEIRNSISIKNNSRYKDDYIIENYKDLIKKADILFFDKKYQYALEYYKKASFIMPNESYPKMKTFEATELIKKHSHK
jgi:hypothetical protein